MGVLIAQAKLAALFRELSKTMPKLLGLTDKLLKFLISCTKYARNINSLLFPYNVSLELFTKHF